MSHRESIHLARPRARGRAVRAAAAVAGFAILVAVSVGGSQEPPRTKAEPKPPAKTPPCKTGDPATATEAPAVVSDFQATPPVVTINNGFEGATEFQNDLGAFAEEEAPSDGLGPTFNGRSCAQCHINPVTGGSSQVAELRAGHREPDPSDPDPNKVRFVEPVGGSVIQQLAIDPAVQKRVLPEDNIRTLRMSNTVLGTGFIEVIPDCDILEYRNTVQKAHRMQGFPVRVVAAVAPKPKKKKDGPCDFVQVERIGRFGWKCQEASLLNFAAGAYLTEMVITSPLFPDEVLSNLGVNVALFDKVADPEDAATMANPFGEDVEAFARFMRATRVPARDTTLAATPDAVAGEALFKDNAGLGCAICHRPEYITPPEGTPIRTLGGKRGSDMPTVPAALGNKKIHPYSDFLLHDIGTGDGIVQVHHANKPPCGFETRERIPDDVAARDDIPRIDVTPEKAGRRALYAVDPAERDERAAFKMRTAPLWGLRSRPQLLHDGSALTIEEAILRHKGQAEGVRLKYEALSDAQKQQLLAFLRSL
jgi:CxxC motif-containing protein (DUF1111 family)